MLLVSTEICNNNDPLTGCPLPSGTNHYFFITGSVASYFQVSVSAFSSMPTLTPSQAFAFDKKVDDGLPMSGRVKARYALNTQLLVPFDLPSSGCNTFSTSSQPVPAASGACVSNATGNSYLLSDGTPECALSVLSTF
jgi:hypothetical protein